MKSLEMMVWSACALAFPALAHADSVTTEDAVKESISVRAAPAPKSALIGRLGKDEFAERLGATRYWHKVRLDDGTVGYVRRAWSRLVPEGDAEADDDSLTVTFIDVGQGDAALLQLGDVDVMIDAGPRGAWRRGPKVADGRLEALFITHPHDDHYGGAKSVLDAFAVKKLYTNGERRGPPREDKEPKSWSEFEEAANAEGLELSTLKVGQEISPAPGLTLTVLATGDPGGGEFPDTDSGTDINNDSLVLMAEYAGRRILFTGDLENDAESMLLERHCRAGEACERLHADVLKVPHHGSASFEPAFLSTVGASWAVVSADFKNAKHHLPRAEVIDSLRSMETKVLSTSSEGDEPVTLTIAADGKIGWRRPGKRFAAWHKRGDGYASKTYAQGE